MIKPLIDTARGSHGGFSLGRLLTITAAIALTFGFYKEALTNGLEYRDYPAYALAMMFSYAPAKAVDLINAIKGPAQTLPPPSPVVEIPEVK